MASNFLEAIGGFAGGLSQGLSRGFEGMRQREQFEQTQKNQEFFNTLGSLFKAQQMPKGKLRDLSVRQILTRLKVPEDEQKALLSTSPEEQDILARGMVALKKKFPNLTEESLGMINSQMPLQERLGLIAEANAEEEQQSFQNVLTGTPQAGAAEQGVPIAEPSSLQETTLGGANEVAPREQFLAQKQQELSILEQRRQQSIQRGITNTQKGKDLLRAFDETIKQKRDELKSLANPEAGGKPRFESFTDESGNRHVVALDPRGQLLFDKVVGIVGIPSSKFRQDLQLRSAGKNVKTKQIQTLSPDQAKQILRDQSLLSKLGFDIESGTGGGGTAAPQAAEDDIVNRANSVADKIIKGQ